LARLGLDPAKLRETVAVFDEIGPEFRLPEKETPEEISSGENVVQMGCPPDIERLTKRKP
jgi:hypothetical protein